MLVPNFQNLKFPTLINPSLPLIDPVVAAPAPLSQKFPCKPLQSLLCNTHYKLHNAHYKLYTTHFRLYNTHYNVHTTKCKLNTANWSLHTNHWNCTLDIMKKKKTVNCTLHIAHCTLHNSLCTVNTAHTVQVLLSKLSTSEMAQTLPLLELDRWLWYPMSYSVMISFHAFVLV